MDGFTTLESEGTMLVPNVQVRNIDPTFKKLPASQKGKVHKINDYFTVNARVDTSQSTLASPRRK